MDSTFARFLRVNLPPPSYLAEPSAGIDISTSGIKVAIIKEHSIGLELAAFGEERLDLGAVVEGEIAEPMAVIDGLKKLAKQYHIRSANIGLPEARGYLFEADVAGATPAELRTAVEQRLDEFVPLPPADVAFDFVATGKKDDLTHIVGVGYAKRIIDATLAALEDAGIRVEAIVSENFALPRALLRSGSAETAMIIDIGKTTTKLLVATGRVPRFATTLDIGGHALTLAVQKHFGVTEEEAKKVKAEKGIAPGEGDEEYRAAMLTTVSAMREEIARRLEYWQTHLPAGSSDAITRAILVGGNATVRGLPEYLEASLKVPVEQGDVFVNLAKRDEWLPPIEYTESLAYGTAIGLALRDYGA